MENYKNPKLPIVERVDDLMARMSIEQKLSQMQCIMTQGTDPSSVLGHFPNGVGEIGVFGGGTTAKETMETNRAIVDCVMKTPLGIPPLIHVEAITGLMAPETTVYPSAIGLGATFSPETVYEMSDIIRKQMMTSGFRQALSPVMDVGRDPRWGRIGETYSEDPTLAAAMSVAFVKGLQGEDLTEGIVATGKHFLGYSLTDGGLNMASSPIPHRDLREVYAKPFQAAITEGGLGSVMNTYGSIDNELVISSENILTGLLREEMGFEGVVVSDYMSIQHIPQHRMSKDMNDAGIMALKAGLDSELPFPQGFSKNIIDAVQNGELDIAYVDRAVRRILTTKFKLGLFENPYPREDWFDKEYSNSNYKAHSLKAARKSIVLLKNDGLLPLSKDTKNIAVIGPHADSLRMLFGCYTHPASVEMDLGRAKGEMAGMGGASSMAMEEEDDGFVQSALMPNSDVLREHEIVTAEMEKVLRGKTPTVLESIRSKCPNAEISYTVGCEIAGTNRSEFDIAVEQATNADVVVLTLGGKYGWGRNCTIGEGIDCDDIGLPGIQEEFAKAVIETGTPCIVVHMDARPLSSEYIAENASAVLECWFPGTTGGESIADVIFGDYNPAGRLPVTVARNAGQIPIHIGQKIGNSYFTKDMNMVLARYCEGDKTPLFYFGHGLSYSSFAYSNLKVQDEALPNGTVKIFCDVSNTGTVDGDEVVQLYISDLLSSMVRPAIEFAGCERVFLKAGETKTVSFCAKTSQFAFMDKDNKWVVEPGEMAVFVGGSSNNLMLEGKFSITEYAEIDPIHRGFFAKTEIL